MVVDGENLACALPTIDGVQYVDVFMGLARQKVNLNNAVVQTKTIGRPWAEPIVLKQSVLHHPEQGPAVGADRQTLHAAIGLAARRVVEQLGVRVGARFGDEKLGWQGKATQPTSMAVELKNKGAVLIRDVDVSVVSDSNPFRIEPEGGELLI